MFLWYYNAEVRGIYMMMQEKNQKVEGYLVNLAFELNNKYKNIVDDKYPEIIWFP